MADRGHDWRSILLGVASLAGALSAFAVAVLMILYAVFLPVHTDLNQNGPTTLQAIIVASGIMLTGAIFLPAAYYSFQRLRGVDIPEAAPKILKPWQGTLLVLLWAGAAVLAQLLEDNDIFKWFTPPLYLLAIGTPVYFLIRLAAGGLNAGSRQRFWGIPVASIALGMTLSIIAEATLVIIGLAGGAVYLFLHPEQLSVFKHITDQFTNASRIESALHIVEPLLNNPLIIVLALFFFSGFIPVIEETAKSIAPWTVFDHLESPAQGFVIGTLSGAGFGLVESLLASTTPDSSWAATLMIRGGSTMMHMLTASLTGWGIASFRTNKSTRRVIGSYALAMFLHSLWNAAVMMILFGGLRMSSNVGLPDPIGEVFVFFGISVLVILCLAIPLTLAFINRRLRTPLALTSAITSEKSLAEVDQKPGGGMEGVQ
jgi:RsiW-degrading membrane proteinase PrsW (M82 family)